MNKRKKIPTFKSETAEAAFWSLHDTTDYMDWSKAKAVRFSKLKPSTCTISLRLPSSLLDTIKIMANKEDVPYQSLMKILLAEGVALHIPEFLGNANFMLCQFRPRKRKKIRNRTGYSSFFMRFLEQNWLRLKHSISKELGYKR